MTIDIQNIIDQQRETLLLVQSLREELNRRQTYTYVDEEVLTVSKIAKLLDKEIATIYGMVYERRIPFHKPNGTGRLYFLRSEIMEWLKNGKKPVWQELDEKARQVVANRIDRRTKSKERKGGRVCHV